LTYESFQKFAVPTRKIVATIPDSTTVLSSRVFQNKEEAQVFHQFNLGLGFALPDKYLLQYDCGKLQTLAKLLRDLKAKGSRALIFTQMTKMLDLLEGFLNMHGHIYLRLDGSTNVEQRQVMMDRFNNDTRILVFILSTRSGGGLFRLRFIWQWG
jgi:helicase SWR1